MLTRKDTVMNRSEAADLLASIGVRDMSGLPSKQTVTGKEVFSVLLPSDFNFSGKSRSKEELEIIIKNGKLISGVMDKNNLGEGSGLMLRNLHKRYGEEFAVDLLGKVFRLGIIVLLKRGFTTTIADTDLPDEANEKIKEVFVQSDKEVSELIAKHNSGELESFPGRTSRETLELKILEVLNKARNETGQIVADYADPRSHTLIMANSGARGNLLNLAQMAGCVGQQALRGQRIEKGYSNRTLSSFKKNDLGSEAHGFIRSNFKSGLKPAEFFFQAMVGRDSLMDTALRTPKSGYLYRRLSNAMQDLRVEYDGTVRDASGRIIQFKYGEDDIDVCKSEGGSVDVQRVIREL